MPVALRVTTADLRRGRPNQRDHPVRLQGHLTGSMERHIMNVSVSSAAFLATRAPAGRPGPWRSRCLWPRPWMTTGMPDASAAAGPSASPARQPAAGMRRACAPGPSGFVRCYTLWGPQATVNRAIAAGIAGATATAGEAEGIRGARDLESAYKLPVSRRPDQTVRLATIACDTPHLAHYLAVPPEGVWPARPARPPRILPRGQPERPHVPVTALRPGRVAAGTWKSPWTFR